MFVVGVVLLIVPALVVDGLPFGRGELRDLGLAAGGGVLYTVATACFLLALRVGKLSLVTVLACLDGAFAAAISIALGERIGAMAAAGLAVITSLAMAGVFVFYGSIEAFSPLTTVTVASLAGLVVVLPIAAVRRVALPPRSQTAGVLGVSVLDMLAFLAGSAALALGPVSVAAVLQAQTATLSTLLGVAALRERPAWWQMVGIVATIVGVSLLAWAM
jgi:drug/metabolite transporter (DMT)-like permease